MRSSIFAIQSNVHGLIKTRRLRWVGHVARMGENRDALEVLVGKPEGKRPLERRRCRWEDNIQVHLKEIRQKGVEWISWLQTETIGGLL
jgi:hypothetical protein